MRTPSESESPRRSVFGNYTPEDADAAVAVAPYTRSTPSALPLQEGIDRAVCRGFVYRYLAQAFDYPNAEAWRWLCSAAIRETLGNAVAGSGRKPSSDSERKSADANLSAALESVLAATVPEALESFRDDYIAVFGHGARGSCPINEIEYGELRADPLFQPHRLADLGAFYRAFGLEFADGGERPDHLSVELEFMAVLALREAQALEHQLVEDEHAVNRSAETTFLREHLGRWAPAFCRRVARALPAGACAALAGLLGAWIESECRRVGVPSGSTDLSLRPVDEGAESICASCGITELPPGADHDAESPTSPASCHAPFAG